MGFCALLLVAGEPQFAAQDDATHFRVAVNLVQLNVAVTDSKGNYISGLRPEDFTVSEDKIPQKIATFEEGNGPAIHPGQRDLQSSASDAAAETAEPGRSGRRGFSRPYHDGRNGFLNRRRQYFHSL